MAVTPSPGFWRAIGLICLLLAVQLGVGVLLALGEIAGMAKLPSWLQVVAENGVAFAVALWVAVRAGRPGFGEVASLRPVAWPLLAALVPLAVGLSVLLSEADNVTRSIVPAPA